MKEKEVQDLISKVFRNIFNMDNELKIEDVKDKYAFDVKLPRKVKDNVTKQETWTEMETENTYITQSNMEKYDNSRGWMVSKREVKSLKDILEIWNRINYITTERVSNSENVSESDTIYDCTNVYRSSDCHRSKNVVFCDGCADGENIIACQRSGKCVNCLRVDDSGSCSNSYNVIYSAKIVNSYFIQDCNNLYECMFCSHIANKRYCIANMQFSETEYFKIKKSITEWIVNCD